MRRRYRKLNEDEDHDGISAVAATLPIHRPVAIYFRQSITLGSGNTSTLLQVPFMTQFLERLGWQSEDIVVVDADQNTSGTKPMVERPGLRTLIGHIVDGTVGAVAAILEDRFFRDAKQIETNRFIDICRKHQVFVITPNHVYAFFHPTYGQADMRLFREKTAQAASYLNSYLGRMRQGITYATALGRFTSITPPAGYMVDLRRFLSDGDSDRDGYGSANPDWRKLCPFEPYADTMRQYFELVAGFSGTWKEAYLYIERHGPFFPEETEFQTPEAHYLWRAVRHRSPITNKLLLNRRDFPKALTNAAYVGHFAIQGVVTRWNNHKAIVSSDLFSKVFNRISRVSLDGLPNAAYTGPTDERNLPRQERRARRSVAFPAYNGVISMELVSNATTQRVPLTASWVQTNRLYRYNASIKDSSGTIIERRSINCSFIDNSIDKLLVDKLCTLHIALASRIEEMREIAASHKHLFALPAAELFASLRGQSVSHVQHLLRSLQINTWSSEVSTKSSPLSLSDSKAESPDLGLSFEQRVQMLSIRLKALAYAQEALSYLIPSLDTLVEVIDNWPRVEPPLRRLVFDGLAKHVLISRINHRTYHVHIQWLDGGESLDGVVRPATFKRWTTEETLDLIRQVRSSSHQAELLRQYPDYSWHELGRAYQALTGCKLSADFQGDVPFIVETTWQDILDGQAKQITSHLEKRIYALLDENNCSQCPFCSAAHRHQRSDNPKLMARSFRCIYCHRHYWLRKQ